MLNQEKVRLMTKLATFEQGKGKKCMAVQKYSRKDYVGLQMIKTFFCSTIAFVLLLLMRIFYEVEEFLENLYEIDIIQTGVMVIKTYIVFMLVCEIITIIVYWRRHIKISREVKGFQKKLKKLEKIYEREET